MVGPGGGPMVTVAKLAKVCLGQEAVRVRHGSAVVPDVRFLDAWIVFVSKNSEVEIYSHNPLDEDASREEAERHLGTGGEANRFSCHRAGDDAHPRIAGSRWHLPLECVSLLDCRGKREHRHGLHAYAGS